MYFVDREQIERRLAFIDVLVEGCKGLARTALPDTGDRRLPEEAFPLLAGLAHERVLHLAIETVTDVGSLMIDGFLLRDASSYEDIVDILRDEQAISPELHSTLFTLVKLRKPLVQDYTDWNRSEFHPALAFLPEALTLFRERVRAFIAKELSRL